MLILSVGLFQCSSYIDKLLVLYLIHLLAQLGFVYENVDLL